MRLEKPNAVAAPGHNPTGGHAGGPWRLVSLCQTVQTCLANSSRERAFCLVGLRAGGAPTDKDFHNAVVKVLFWECIGCSNQMRSPDTLNTPDVRIGIAAELMSTRLWTGCSGVGGQSITLGQHSIVEETCSKELL